MITPHPGWVEQSAERWAELSAKIIHRAVSEAGIDPGEILSLSIASRELTVVSIDPLEIAVEQKNILQEVQLILTRNVTDHTVEMTVGHETEDEARHTHEVSDTYTGGGSSAPTEHRHKYEGRKKFLVHNGLAVGEHVLLVREQGGKRYIVWDRVGQ